MPASITNHLVCIHGNSSSKKVFESQLAHFENIVAQDLPGHGDSIPSLDPAKAYTLKEVRALLTDRYKKLESIVLIGNSLGGHLAIEIAPDLPNLKGIILFGTPPLKKPLNMEEAFLPTDALGAYFQGTYDEKILREKLPVITSQPQHFEPLLQDFMKTDTAFRDVLAKAVMEDDELLDEVEILSKVKVPVYVIHGKQDPSVNVEYIKGLDGITKVYEIDNCGHYASLEQPEKFNAIVEEIMDELAS